MCATQHTQIYNVTDVVTKQLSQMGKVVLTSLYFHVFFFFFSGQQLEN